MSAKLKNLGEDKKRISFVFHPYNFENRSHFVTKQDGAKQRRYLIGVSSGTAVDGHGEKMTPTGIKSFQDQANSGDVLLYDGAHYFDHSQDIGKLTHSEILPNNDWLTEFRLYDEDDGMGQETLDRANKLWAKVNGLPPYSSPKELGFSIEGYIPDGGLKSIDRDKKRVIDNVMLDGVVIIPRPAYRSSIAQAVYKALDEIPPWNLNKMLGKGFRDKVVKEDLTNNYFKKRFQFQDMLEDEIENIMVNPKIGDKEENLDKLFNEYKTAMMELVFESSSMFDKERYTGDVIDTERLTSDAIPVVNPTIYERRVEFKKNNKIAIAKSLITEVDKLLAKLK